MSENSKPIEKLTNGQIPDLMTEAELIQYLRIPEISNAKDSFDRMMMEKQNLFRLYQRIANKEDA